MAAALNCEEGGCGRCMSCGKVSHEIHPDVFLIEPEGNFITIGQVRQLQQFISLKNYEGNVRVFIIDEADRFTVEAANALLKGLEEPPPGVVFILVTANIEAMLPTVVSRCRQIQFRSIPARVMVSFLIDKHGLSYDEASLATKLSSGVLGAAISFATSVAKKERRKKVLGIARDIGRFDSARLSFTAEELLFEVKRPLGELKEKHEKELRALKEQFGSKGAPSQVKHYIEQRHKREITREEHQGFEEILTIMISWFRDVAFLKETGRQDLLTNQDRILDVSEHADLLTCADISKCLQILEETKQLLRFNVNMQLAFETMLFKIHSVVAVQRPSYFGQ
jgi:DNA polymerase-3 subunit delta'